jgi:hypothetical protein
MDCGKEQIEFMFFKTKDNGILLSNTVHQNYLLYIPTIQAAKSSFFVWWLVLRVKILVSVPPGATTSPPGSSQNGKRRPDSSRCLTPEIAILW